MPQCLQRAKLVRKPPHILVTTPESLYLLLTAQRGREALQNVETIMSQAGAVTAVH